jgi:hypothetical protein
MRAGTRTELKRKCTPQGRGTKTPIRIGYEFIHLCCGHCPFISKILTMFLPRPDQ